MDKKERMERIIDLKNSLDEFENKVTELMQEGRDLAMGMQRYSGSVATEGHQLEGYFVNRLRNFLECNEMFRFDHARETLEDEMEEIKAGVYDDEEAI